MDKIISLASEAVIYGFIGAIAVIVLCYIKHYRDNIACGVQLVFDINGKIKNIMLPWQEDMKSLDALNYTGAIYQPSKHRVFLIRDNSEILIDEEHILQFPEDNFSLNRHDKFVIRRKYQNA